MYAKIFGQIFDSSIAADHVVRHVFMDLLVLADRDGVVDMTLDAIARRTNVPLEIVNQAITTLMEPDNRSRSDLEQGRRLILLDSHRDWGWQIVNYEHYRTIRDEEARKAYFRDYKREYRHKQKKTSPTQSTPVHTVSTPVLDSPTMSTKAEADTEADTKRQKLTPARQKRRLAKKASPPTKTEITDARHALFKAAIWEYWKSKNTIDCPWGVPEGRSLAIWLKSCPNITLPQFTEFLRNRYRSDVNHAERPSLWISRITNYANGPVKSYGGNGNGKQSRAQAELEAALRLIDEQESNSGDASGHGPDAGREDGQRANSPLFLATRQRTV